MLYVNETVKKQSQSKDWGTFEFFAMGEEGRGRRLMTLPSGIKADTITKGLHDDITIGTTRNGRPRINSGRDNEIYLMLTSSGGYTRRGNGYFQVPALQDSTIDVLAFGNGADGDAGRIGSWACILMRVPNDADFITKIQYSGGGNEPHYVFCHEGSVYEGTKENIIDLCDHLDIACPLIVKEKDGSSHEVDDGFWANPLFEKKVREADRSLSTKEIVKDTILREGARVIKYADLSSWTTEEKRDLIKDYIKRRGDWFGDWDLLAITDKFGDLLRTDPESAMEYTKAAVMLYRTYSPNIDSRIKSMLNDIFSPEIEKAFPERGSFLYGVLDKPPLWAQEKYILNDGQDFSKAGDYIEKFKKLSAEEQVKPLYYNKSLLQYASLTEEAQIELIRKDPHCLFSIESPSDALVLAAIKQDPDLLHHISGKLLERLSVPEMQKKVFEEIKDYKPWMINRGKLPVNPELAVRSLEYYKNASGNIYGRFHDEILTSDIRTLAWLGIPEVAFGLMEKGYITVDDVKSVDKFDLASLKKIVKMGYSLSYDECREIVKKFELKDLKGPVLNSIVEVDPGSVDINELVASKLLSPSMAKMLIRDDCSIEQASIIRRAGIANIGKLTADIALEGSMSAHKMMDILEHSHSFYLTDDDYEKIAEELIKLDPEYITKVNYNGKSEGFTKNLLTVLEGKQIKSFDIGSAEDKGMPTALICKCIEISESDPTYSFSERSWDGSGRRSFARAFIIDPAGHEVPFDEFEWDNPNHRFKKEAKDADGRRKWSNVPVGCIAVSAKADAGDDEPIRFQLRRCYTSPTGAQLECLRNIEQELINSFGKEPSAEGTWSEQAAAIQMPEYAESISRPATIKEDEIALCVTGITNLTYKEAQQIPKDILQQMNGTWWLSSEGNSTVHASAVCRVSSSVYVSSPGYHATSKLGVRPALKISNLEDLGVETGTVLEFAGHSWTVIPGGMALCNSVIGETAYKQFHVEYIDGANRSVDKDDMVIPDGIKMNDYGNSDLKKFTEDWALSLGIITHEQITGPQEQGEEI